MGLTLVTPPVAFPVTLAEAKAQCRIDSSDEDALINGLIAAATDYVEQYTGRSIVSQTWRLSLDDFSDSILLPKGPVSSVTTVGYYDTAGALQTVSADDYTVDNSNDPAWIVINTDASWPDVQDGVNMVRITYVAGYATTPPSIKHALLLLIAQWFDHRADVSDKAMIAMPNAVEALLTNYRSYSF